MIETATDSKPSLPPVLEEAIVRFRAWVDKSLLVEQDESRVTIPLYHYTNGQGLRGILESGRVWFTDYRHLNDPSELTHGIDMAHDVAQSLCTGPNGRARMFLDWFKDLLRPDKFTATLVSLLRASAARAMI